MAPQGISSEGFAGDAAASRDVGHFPARAELSRPRGRLPRLGVPPEGEAFGRTGAAL